MCSLKLGKLREHQSFNVSNDTMVPSNDQSQVWKVGRYPLTITTSVLKFSVFILKSTTTLKQLPPKNQSGNVACASLAPSNGFQQVWEVVV